ncbi:MAG: HAMP domain-containing protein, partial [Planctomycetota bacterium]
MARKRLLWRLFFSHLLILGIALATAMGYAGRELGKFYRRRMVETLTTRARLLRRGLGDAAWAGNSARIDELCKQMGRDSATRFTAILPGGRVLGDSEKNPADMDEHADRPEVLAALRGEVGSSVRRSDTLQQEMMYVALPVEEEGRIVGVVRASLPLLGLETALSGLYREIALGGAAVALLAAGASFALAKRITRPLEELNQGLKRFGRGELGHKLLLPNSEELGALAESANAMAADLNARLEAVVRQRNERQAVFDSMGEGLLAVDCDERILYLNRAAE